MDKKKIVVMSWCCRLIKNKIKIKKAGNDIISFFIKFKVHPRVREIDVVIFL